MKSLSLFQNSIRKISFIIYLLTIWTNSNAQTWVTWNAQSTLANQLKGTVVINGTTINATITVSTNNSPVGGTYRSAYHTTKTLVRGDSWNTQVSSKGNLSTNLGVSNDTQWVLNNNDSWGYPNIISIQLPTLKLKSKVQSNNSEDLIVELKNRQMGSGYSSTASATSKAGYSNPGNESTVVGKSTNTSNSTNNSHLVVLAGVLKILLLLFLQVLMEALLYWQVIQ